MTALVKAERVGHLASSAIGSVLRLGDSDDLISLAAGSPAPESFCAENVSEVAVRLLADRPDTLQYGDTAGLLALREWVAADVSGVVGRECTVEDTVLSHGSQQALDLICKAMIDPGDTVIVDRPSYVGALQVFRLFQANLVDVVLTEDRGLSELEERFAAGLRAKLIYVVSNHANPTGATMSSAQRVRLAELATRHNVLVVEDDPYGDIGFTGAARPPAIASLSPDVVRLGSFSKTLFPAARIGFMTAPRSLVPVLNNLKQAADLGNSHFIQLIVNELVRTPGFLAERKTRARALYQARRDALTGALRQEFGAELEFQEPGGGFFVWARLTGGASSADLLNQALKENMAFVPGGAFYAGDPDDSTLRLSFSCAPIAVMPEAARRLRAAWSRLDGSGS